MPPQILPDPLRIPRDQLEEAERLRQDGKLDRAESICHTLTRRYPAYMAAFHTLGLVHLDKGNFERALDCLVRAVMLNPRSWMSLTALSLAYLRLGASEMAAQTLEQARLIKPEDASILVSLAEIHKEEREYELAQDAYRQALALDDDLAGAAIGLGLCCTATGQYSEAASVFADVFKRGHRSLDLLRAISTLPPRLVGIDLLGELERLKVGRSEENAEFKNTFAFVRAAALDMAGRHADAWECLLPANRTLFAAKQEELKARMARQAENLAWLRATPIRAGADSDNGGQPVSLFILGPSRSGKTSLERLIGSLDGVKRGYEGPSVENAVRRAFQTAALPTSSYLEHLPASLYPLCREFYREELMRRAGPARVFTNTVAARIHDVARVVAAIPNVRLAFVKRDLDDNALRIYMSKYLRGNSYAYQLKSIRDHLIWYHQMIDLMAEKFADIVRVINYEAMVADPAAALREVADLCGLTVRHESPPELGSDCGCAEPYREFMAAGG